MNLAYAIHLGLTPRGGEANQVGLRIVPEGAAATGILTLTGNAVADETVTIGTQVYTWKAVPAAANEVDIGATASDSIDNLIRAINDIGTEGTHYGTGTVQNADVWAKQGAGDTMDVTARKLGTGPNSVATTEGMTAGSWGGGTLAGGLDIGSTPADSANWLPLCYTGENLSAQVQYDRSERICATTGGAARMPRKRTVAGHNPGGSVNGEVQYGATMHELLRAALGGDWIPSITVVGQDDLFVDVGIRGYTIEKYYQEVASTFENWVGAVLSQLQISIPAGQKATFVANFLARVHDALDTVSLVGTGSVAADATTDIMAGSDDFANLEFDDATVTGLVVQQIDLTINNNARGLLGLGQLGPLEHRFGDATITGTMRAYLAAGSFGLYKDALANTTKKLDFDMIDPAGNKYHVEMPQIVLTGEPPSVPGRNQDVFFNMPFEAHTQVVQISRDDA